MTNIHVKIKNLRNKNNYKQKQVAAYLGISQQAYSCYELDKRELPSRHAVDLTRLYHVSMDYIYDVVPESAASYDLDSEFVQGVPLKDVIYRLEKLDYDNRIEILRIASYLIHSQVSGKKKK